MLHEMTYYDSGLSLAKLLLYMYGTSLAAHEEKNRNIFWKKSGYVEGKILRPLWVLKVCTGFRISLRTGRQTGRTNERTNEQPFLILKSLEVPSFTGRVPYKIAFPEWEKGFELKVALNA